MTREREKVTFDISKLVRNNLKVLGSEGFFKSRMIKGYDDLNEIFKNEYSEIYFQFDLANHLISELRKDISREKSEEEEYFFTEKRLYARKMSEIEKNKLKSEELFSKVNSIFDKIYSIVTKIERDRFGYALAISEINKKNDIIYFHY